MSAYEKAVSDALASADSAAEKMIAAAFSIATAYGALIALVAPKDQAGPWQLVLPFIPLMGAAVAAMWARGRGINVDIKERIEEVTSDLRAAVDSKRFRSWIALLLMILAVVIGGWIVVDFFSGEPTDSTDVDATVWLNPDAAQEIGNACGIEATLISGVIDKDELDADKPLLPIRLKERTCSGYAEVFVQRAQIAAIGTSR